MDEVKRAPDQDCFGTSKAAGDVQCLGDCGSAAKARAIAHGARQAG